mmetsp:Transcript_18664/g.75028  ORF Transcript_18664/g.75028 Transcript_18664/m.75028 type:complete len:358 (-) Transcript_18664:2610-3683(-)
MRIVTWNVNSVRSFRGRFKSVLDSFDADIVCLQETKLNRNGLEEEFAVPEGYDAFYAFSDSVSGYSGVATFASRTRSKFAVPLRGEAGLLGSLGAEMTFHESDGFTEEELVTMDMEGRVMVTDHGPFLLINVYVPSTGSLERFDFKLRFCLALQRRIEAMRAAGRKVVLVGDLNISYLKIDHCAPEKEVRDVTGWYTHPARHWLRSMLRVGGGHLEDAFRVLHPTELHAFTCWSQKTSARETNYGVRIDHILVDEHLVEALADSAILSEITGSDHCPVRVELREVSWSDRPMECRPSPPGCAKYLPELGRKRQLSLARFVVPGQKEIGQKRPKPPTGMPLKTPEKSLMAESSMPALY